MGNLTPSISDSVVLNKTIEARCKIEFYPSSGQSLEEITTICECDCRLVQKIHGLVEVSSEWNDVAC